MIKSKLAVSLALALFAASQANSAQYTVEALPLADKGVSSFAVGISESGTVAANVSSIYNSPIDLELINFDTRVTSNPITGQVFVADPNATPPVELPTIRELLTDPDAAELGDFNSADYTLIRAIIGLRTNNVSVANFINFFNSTGTIRGDFGNFVTANIGDQLNQQFANITGYSVNDANVTLQAGFAEQNDNGITFLSNQTLLQGVGPNGEVLGRSQSSFITESHTTGQGTDTELTTDFVVNTFANRGFVNISGLITELAPIDTNFGGLSEARDMNSLNQVVGSGTVSFDETSTVGVELEFGLEQCSQIDTIPESACINSLTDVYTASSGFHSTTRGLVWQLDDSGAVTETRQLGLLFEPEVGDDTIYNTSAVAINNLGMIVGQSADFFEFDSGTRIPVSYATLFDGDQVINMTPEISEDIARFTRVLSTAVDVNDNNIAVGFRPESINGAIRNKLFVYDINDASLVSPDGFFNGSATTPTAMNNLNQIVGFGEIEASQTNRRTAGFLYDHNQGTFTNVNNLVSCDSPYNIVEANDINDQGQIAATAVVSAPLRDARGEIVLDSEGQQILTEQVIGVKLTPIAGGTPEICDLPAEDVIRERQGASALWLVLGLIPFVGLRVRRKMQVKALK